MPDASTAVGRVFLVGSGPGDPDLITVKAQRLLHDCDVVVYDYLTPDELVVTLPERIEHRYVGKKAGRHSLPQEEINDLLVELAKQGKRVVRLKGGDPFVFGRGGEEAQHLRQHGIPFEIVPGITSGVAAPAYVGIPTTDRRVASYVMFVTGHRATERVASDVPWDWIGQARNGTIVVYMGVSELPGIVSRLIEAGMSPDTPAAAVERGTFPTQRLVRSRLADLPDEVQKRTIKPPTVFVIGETVAMNDQLEWIQHRPLSGLRVMVTRPVDQSKEIYARLRGLGAEVLPYATIATRQELDQPAWDRVKQLDNDNRWLVVTSENGVRYFFQQWLREIDDLRGLARYRIAAVGAGTARALSEIHLRADFIPVKATTQSMAREMVEKLDMSGATVVRVRGTLADDRIERALADGGAEVIPMTVYHTYTPKWAEDVKDKLLSFPPHVVLFTSGSSADGLAENLTPDELKELADTALVVSIGPSTTKIIEGLGISVGLEARVHNIPAMIDELVAYHQVNPIV